MLRPIALALTFSLLGFSVLGCGVPASSYQDGEARMTDDGAFLVTLHSELGTVGPGMNGFELHVGMPGTDEGDGGFGIPGLLVSTTIVNGVGEEAPPPMARELGSGDYSVQGVMLDGPGPWLLAFDLETPGSLEDHVEFTFDL